MRFRNCSTRRQRRHDVSWIREECSKINGKYFYFLVVMINLTCYVSRVAIGNVHSVVKKVTRVFGFDAYVLFCFLKKRIGEFALNLKLK